MRLAQNHDAGGGAAGVPEQRRGWREPVVASGVLTAAGGAGGAAGQRVVRVVNVSDGGVGFVTQGALSRGTEHDLVVAGMPDRSGRVRVAHCRALREGFEVGAEYVRGGGRP